MKHSLASRWFFILIFLMGAFPFAFSQGTLRGKITNESGEPLIGATVLIRSQTVAGTVTDLDGNYSVQINSSQPLPLEISYIGYNTLRDTIILKDGEILIKNYGMVSSSFTIGEVTVTARADRGRENYMEKVKLNTGTIFDFISTETIKKTGDSNVSSAVSRITGVSTYGGFITVRGIGDRYIKTSINGLRIPTLDPFTNNIKLDIFPSSLIDNIIITKTPAPEYAGDWTGAYISIETKDYPEKLSLNLESSFGYNTTATFNEIISSKRSNTDWLGFDNGFRTINHEKPVFYDPSSFKYQEFAGLGLKDYFNNLGIYENTPWDQPNDQSSIYTRLALVQLGFLGQAQFYDLEALDKAIEAYNSSELRLLGIEAATKDLVKMGQSLPNTWLTVRRKVPVDFSQSFSIGNQGSFLGIQVGYILGIRYSASTQFSDSSFFGRSRLLYNSDIDLSNTGLIYSKSGAGQNSVGTNTLSALINTSLKFNPNNSISVLFMPNIIGVNKAKSELVTLAPDYSGSRMIYGSVSQHYESRRQLVYQLRGHHYIPSLRMKLDINASLTNGKSNAPDYRQLIYTFIDQDAETLVPGRLMNFNNEVGNTRVFRELSEDLFDSHFSAKIPLFELQNLKRELRFGGSFQTQTRKASEYFYILPTTAFHSVIEDGDIEQYLSLQNFAFINGTVPRYYQQYAGPNHNTIGLGTIAALFLMTDYAIIPKIKISGGIRAENIRTHTDILEYYEKQYPESDQRRLGKRPSINSNLFFLPHINFIYHLKQTDGQSVNLRFNYSKSTGLPSLRELTPFTVYDFEMLGFVRGNSKLKPVQISNYDLRGEAYFASDNSISISLFYKDFKNHIEMIRQELEEIYYSWQNTDHSYATGVELEGSIKLIKNLEFRANGTIVESKTQLKSDSIPRTMFGQAPYVINALLTYNSPKGLEASISYNVQGTKLVITGTYEDDPDIYELSRNLIDFRLTKNLGKKFVVTFKIRDLINEPSRRAYKFSNNRWVDFDRFNYGSVYSFSISYKLN